MRPLKMSPTLNIRLLAACTLLACLSVARLSAAEDEKPLGDPNSPSRLSDESIPLQLNAVPHRPPPTFFLEIGENFLGNGNIQSGFELPTGAVWQPYFIVFGTLRTGLQSFGTDKLQGQEWANRLDLFGNLYLTFTERIVVGIRPLDRDGRFTSYTIRPTPPGDAFNNKDINAEITTLFFEGEFGELFPFLDPYDRHGLDYGFSVGRQLISFQEGMLINDNIDAVGITKINWKTFGINFRWTWMYGWNKINRTNIRGANREDGDAKMFGLFTETDTRSSTIAFDFIYLDAKDTTGKGVYAGLSSVQRWGGFNTSFRVLGSYPVGDETPTNTKGLLLFSEVSWTPHGTVNFAYVNAFLGIERFRSAARDPSVGGALAPRAGVLFASPGLGSYGAPLSTIADKVAGGAIGYQFFFAGTRQQVTFELGGRYSTKEGEGDNSAAFGAAYQLALGQRFVVRLESFVGRGVNNATSVYQTRFGGRFEILLQL